MTTKEQIERISKLLNELSLDDITSAEYDEMFPKQSINDLKDELWLMYCFAEDVWYTINMGDTAEQEPKIDDMTSSHSEKYIYKGCISLMRELVGAFYEWLDFIGVDIAKLDREEQFEKRFYPTHIVERLFLWHTSHSGGTSQHMKCDELGIDTNEAVIFDFSDELGNEE